MIGKIYSPLIFFEKKSKNTESFMDYDFGSFISSYFWGKIPKDMSSAKRNGVWPLSGERRTTGKAV